MSIRVTIGDTYDGEVLEGSGLLNVLQGGGEVLELQVDGLLGSLGILDGLGLEGLNGLELSGHVIGDGLEGAEPLLDLVDDGLVLEDGSVGGEVDGGGLLGEDLELAAGVLVALLEGLEGGDGLATEAERAGDLGPVKLESCASLPGRRKLAQGFGSRSEARLESENQLARSDIYYTRRLRN